MATTLDLKGLACPLPVLRANKALKTMVSGDELTVLVTDRAAPADFRNYCESYGHLLLECTVADGEGVMTLVIRKGNEAAAS